MKRNNAKRTKETKQTKPNTLKKMFDFDENQTGNPVSDHHSYHFDHFTAICSLQFYVKRLIEGSDLIGLNTELTVVWSHVFTWRHSTNIHSNVSLMALWRIFGWRCVLWCVASAAKKWSGHARAKPLTGRAMAHPGHPLAPPLDVYLLPKHKGDMTGTKAKTRGEHAPWPRCRCFHPNKNWTIQTNFCVEPILWHFCNVTCKSKWLS